MSKKKTMSHDEKLTNVEELLYEKSEPFTLKELEKLAQKEKGVRSMVVKDVIQMLVNDGRIMGDKIGATNFYWLFPSQACELRKRKIGQLDTDIQGAVDKKKKLQQEMIDGKVGKEETDERKQNMKELKQLNEQIREIDEKLAVYRAKDPDLIKKKQKDTKISKDHANMWTDNIFEIRDTMKRDTGRTEDEINDFFGIKSDLDNIN